MSLLAQLRHYQPADEHDLRTRARFIEFVTRHTDCCDRSLVIGHITASSWVVDAAGSCVVLIHHRKLDRWLQPGGHADGSADTESVARREALEETGLDSLVKAGPDVFDLDIHPIPAFADTPAHLHYDVRHAFRLTRESLLVPNDESHEVLWAPIDELEDFNPDPSILRMREKWRRIENQGHHTPNKP